MEFFLIEIKTTIEQILCERLRKVVIELIEK